MIIIVIFIVFLYTLWRTVRAEAKKMGVSVRDFGIVWRAEVKEAIRR